MTITAAGGRGRPGNGHEVADDQSECEQSCQDESLHRTSPSFLPLNHVTDSLRKTLGREAHCTDSHVL